MSLDPQLQEALRRLAGDRPFLLALDFDGVLAPIIDDPAQSRSLPESARAVEQLAARDDVRVAFVSGRDLAGLSAVADAPGRVHLVGSHGAEWQDDLRADHGGLTAEQGDLLDQVTEQLDAIVEQHPGTRVEPKPSAAVLHTRLATADAAESATAAALAGPAALPGVKVTPGKDVVEIAVTQSSKGQAVQWMREHLDVNRVMYIGDDVTDETVFTVLGPDDLSIKVGPGDTAAAHRVESPEAVSHVLCQLLELLKTS